MATSSAGVKQHSSESSSAKNPEIDKLPNSQTVQSQAAQSQVAIFEKEPVEKAKADNSTDRQKIDFFRNMAKKKSTFSKPLDSTLESRRALSDNRKSLNN